MKPLLRDKAVIVTGSTLGIGKAVARLAAAEGARVLVHGLEEEEGREVVASLGEGRGVLHIDDLQDPAAAERIVAKAIDAFGKLDALVNNAALVSTGNLPDTDAARFDRFMQINARAPLLLIKAAFPHLEKTKGCVLNIGSVNAYCGEENLLPYSMSKGALMTMTRNLGDTLAKSGVRVNQINPGWVLTEAEQARKTEQGMDADWPSELPQWCAPAKRLIAPEEIAAAAVFWISDVYGPVSGTVFEMEQYPMIGRNPPKL